MALILGIGGVFSGALFGGLITPVAHAGEVVHGAMIEIDVGQSHIYQADRGISRILVSDDQVVEIKLLDKGQIQLRGLSVGSTDLWVWFTEYPDSPVKHTLSIHRDYSDLERLVASVVGSRGSVQVAGVEGSLMLKGVVPDLETLEQVASLAHVYDSEFVNLMAVAGDHQVQLEVTFAEINRSALRELGLSGLWDDGALIGASDLTLQTDPPVAVSEAFGINAVYSSTFDLTATLSVLTQHNLSKVLAQPTLVALSGQQAEFLAGGELPIPVAQFGDRVTIEFKEYGVQVTFVPTVLSGQVIDMRVYVEVSDVDTANGVTLTDVAIPGFKSRKTQSHLRLKSGMTFAMAGMLSDNVSAMEAKVPILGDIPLVGSLFRYVRHERDEKELMIFVRPRLVRPMNTDEVPTAPGADQTYDPSDLRLFLGGFGSGIVPRGVRPYGPFGVEK